MASLMRCQAAARAADGLDVAGAVVAAALGDRDRALDRIDDGGRADLLRRAGELVAAVRAAHRGHEARAVEVLQQLADRRQAEARALGHLGRRVAAARRRGEAGQDDRAVIGEFADAKHGGHSRIGTILVLILPTRQNARPGGRSPGLNLIQSRRSKQASTASAGRFIRRIMGSQKGLAGSRGAVAGGDNVAVLRGVHYAVDHKPVFRGLDIEIRRGRDHGHHGPERHRQDHAAAG